MAQASYDVTLATRRLQNAGFGAEQTVQNPAGVIIAAIKFL